MTRPKGLPIHGWLCLDKPAGMTSTAAVSRVRRITRAQKVGHGGTLDPLATGVLPIAHGRGDQDRRLRHGGPQALPVHRAPGRGAHHGRCRGRDPREQRASPDDRGDRGRAAGVRRPDRAGAAAVRRGQGRRRARLRSGAARRIGAACAPDRTGRAVRSGRAARSRPCDVRAGVRPRHLCAGAGPRSRRRARLSRARRRAAPAAGRAVPDRGRDVAGPRSSSWSPTTLCRRRCCRSAWRCATCRRCR